MNVKREIPDHAFAFKMVLSDQKAEAKVLDVLWTPSKDGYLKPRVQIEPNCPRWRDDFVCYWIQRKVH